MNEKPKSTESEEATHVNPQQVLDDLKKAGERFDRNMDGLSRDLNDGINRTQSRMDESEKELDPDEKDTKKRLNAIDEHYMNDPDIGFIDRFMWRVSKWLHGR